jgi:hypothetical protein
MDFNSAVQLFKELMYKQLEKGRCIFSVVRTAKSIPEFFGVLARIVLKPLFE